MCPGGRRERFVVMPSACGPAAPGPGPANEAIPANGLRRFERSSRCPAEHAAQPASLRDGRGRAGTRRALRPHHAIGPSRASAPFSPCEALRIFQSAGAKSAAGAGRPSALWRIRRPGRPPRRPHSGDAVPPCPEAVLPREHANSACPLSAPLPLCFAFIPLPQAASPYGALRLRSAPAIRKAQNGTGGEGLRASGLWPERLRGQAEEVCIKPPPRTSGPE